MVLFFLLLFLILLYAAAPRGTLWHEATRLPALWYQTLDIRSDWPRSDLTVGTVGVDCSKTPDEYCDMPFYGPTKDAFLIELLTPSID